jgi:hypothetical protein
MSAWRASRPISETKTVIPLAANATNSVPHSKILVLGAFAALLVVVAVPILFGPPRAANSTLKCYDSAGNYEPCSTPASAFPPRFNGPTAEADQPPRWATTALYQPDSRVTSALDQPAGWTTSAPVARRSSTPEKHVALASCEHRLIPCFFSALGRGITHIASVAANVGRARPASEHP